MKQAGLTAPAKTALARKITLSPPPLRWKILPGADLVAYELELLTDQQLPPALRLQLLPGEEGKILELTPPPQGRSLIQLDGAGPRQQDLGLFRILSILEAFQLAEERLLRPSFDYVSLDSIFLDQARLSLPILPVGPKQAIRLPAQQIYPEFWASWADFYQVQQELAELGRRLAGPGQYRHLQNLLREALSRSGYPSRGEQKNLSSFGQDPSYTEELPRLAGEDQVAELCFPPSARRPGQKKQRLALIVGQEFILGRDPAFADLCFHDPWLGRQHARILRQGGYFYLEDLASLNGTFVDGRRLLRHESLLLPDYCTLSLGKTRLTFQVLGSRTTWYQRDGLPHRPGPAQYRLGH